MNLFKKRLDMCDWRMNSVSQLGGMRSLHSYVTQSHTNGEKNQHIKSMSWSASIHPPAGNANQSKDVSK